MASLDDKRRLIRLARKGKLEGDDGFRYRLAELNKAGITGPGDKYGLDYSDKPFYRTALWEATWKNHEAIVKLLIEKGATIDYGDYQGRTPLHEAAYYGHKGLVELFLDRGHPIDPLDNFGMTPLFRAVEAGRDEVIEFLISRNAQINLLDSDHCTVQHVAAFNGLPDVSEWLLYKGSWKNRFTIDAEGAAVTDRASNPLAAEKTQPGEESDEGAPAAEEGKESAPDEPTTPVAT
eukprot:CAMPEP_0171173972 /NCGR_PEP_ID=MMETSP0790-20130122/10492_1 /TAXON_ID=2925 /ORGANISM="Alexandrium catenella, Strain OF101" /LENGTH=234 /DNA_ID=CAMNT_0011638841 /DNA_START=50 /DNA_END=754 /DNA_ORIENTATION=+